MASTSGRDRRPDALSRLQAAPAPWIGGTGDGPGTHLIDSRVDEDPIDNDLIDDAPTARGRSDWGLNPPPRWLDGGAADRDDREGSAGRSDGDDGRRRPRAPGRGMFVAPPAAIALIAVGVLACIVTAYTVLSGPSDDSPSAARVAFPASAGKAAPSGSVPAKSDSTAGSVGESAAARSAAPTSSKPDELVVSVVGLVRTPGLVRLTGAARVADAIDRAGGGRAGADLLSLNMAQPLRDGDQILVGFADPAGGKGMRSAIVSADSNGAAAPIAGAAPTGSGAAGSAPAAGAGAPVNLNTADEAALDTLPGVGPVTAKAIIDWRSRNGRFTSVDQLGEVDGIGPGRLAKLRDRVTV